MKCIHALQAYGVSANKYIVTRRGDLRGILCIDQESCFFVFNTVS